MYKLMPHPLGVPRAGHPGHPQNFVFLFIPVLFFYYVILGLEVDSW